MVVASSHSGQQINRLVYMAAKVNTFRSTYEQ